RRRAPQQQDVLHGDRHPVQQPARLASPPPLLGRGGLLQRLPGRQPHEGVHLRLDLLGPRERRPDRRHPAELTPAVAVEELYGGQVGQLGDLGHPPARGRQCPGTSPRCLSTTVGSGSPAAHSSKSSTNWAASSSRQPTVSPLMWGDTTRPGTSHSGLSGDSGSRSEEHTSELQSRENLVCRLLLEKKKGEVVVVDETD